MMRRQQGFTLIEVVVAFAIFALSVGALYEVFRDAVRRNAQAEDRQMELLTAQSLLSQLRAHALPWSPEQTGETPQGMRWQVNVAPYDMQLPSDSTWAAFEIDIRVYQQQHSAREVMLRSVEWERRKRGT